jgi:CO/xanthine dehydrogenase Mo-binding subunit
VSRKGSDEGNAADTVLGTGPVRAAVAVVSADFSYVGTYLPGSDAAIKARGALVYGSDIKLPNMLYAKLLLSEIPHGIVAGIDASRAEALPGVVAVFTCFNTPDTPYSRYRLMPRQKSCPEDETLFPRNVRYVGDRVAAVVATSQAVANAAVRLIKVAYEELPALLTADESLGSDVRLHPQGNLLHEYRFDHGEPQAADPEALVTTTCTKTQRIHQAAMEPHVCLAAYDGSENLTIWSPSQGVFGARTVVADLLGLSYNRVRVIKVPTGGSFGAKQEFILEPLTAYLAMQVGKPVKLALDRRQCIRATTTRPPTASTIRTTVTPQGKLREMEVDTVFDAGAYATCSIDYAEAMAHKVPRLYRIPRYRHHGQVAYTNTPITGGARGWGAPEIITAVEVHLDLVAKQLGIDPVDLRLMNLVHPYDVDGATNLSLGDARVRDCLEQGAQAFRWKARRARPAADGPLRRGVGVACGAHKNSQTNGDFIDHSTMALKMNEDGSLALNASLHEIGSGVLASMKLIVAEVLQVSPERVAVREADTDVTPYDFGTYGSRVTYVCGACARAVAQLLKEQLLQTAAYLLKAPAASLVADNGRVHPAADPSTSLTYADIATTIKTKGGRDLIATYTHSATTNPGAYSAQFAEVEVDCETGLCTVTDFLAVGDVGQAINRGVVEGQFRGGAQMGIGYALCEDVVLDRRGRPCQTGFEDYRLATTLDLPDIGVLLIEHEADAGPFGAKSVGEIAAVPTAAAVVNAVNHALGTSLTDIPVTPAKILAALAEALRLDEVAALDELAPALDELAPALGELAPASAEEAGSVLV